MDAGPRISSYEWSGGREPMLRFGPEDGPVVVLALPLFEEANRTRAFGVSILRALAERGIGGVLPELPGQGESEVPTASVSMADWQQAFAAAAAIFGSVHTLAIRGGALITLLASHRSSWVFAPVDGRALMRDLQRARTFAMPDAQSLFDLAGRAPAGTLVDVAGNRVSVDLLDRLQYAIPDRTTPNRLVRLDSDAGEAHARCVGRPLWRAAEPSNDPALAQMLADDIAEWINVCES